MKCHLDGSYIPQFETVAEALKVVEEVFKTLNASEHFSLWVNFGAAQLWNKEQGKYEFENFKKPSDPEEVEDLIAKLLLDKKLIRVVQDPLILEHKFNWHRLNVAPGSAAQTEGEKPLGPVRFFGLLQHTRRAEVFRRGRHRGGLPAQ